MTSITPPEAPQIRAVIEGFLQERLQVKLDKVKDETARQALVESHRRETWIADAAHRVTQIQQVSHGLKFTHPDARGSQLYSQGNPAAGDNLVGTHTLKAEAQPDVVGNAAALDVYKFLRLVVEGRTLLSLASEADPALVAALSDDETLARAWMTAFAGLTQQKGDLTSHTLAKQVYWALDDGDYHLLSPLFPTSLVHRLWTIIREDRFSENTRIAREARRNKQPHEQGFCEYPGLALQKFGGTKPQNISQLNSERYGENYLLASVPPLWQSAPIRPPLRVETIFGGWFGHRSRVYHLTRVLRDFLLSVREVNNLAIRLKRGELVEQIRDELVQFAAELRELTPGWTRHEDCRLNQEECYWLDPWRGQEDDAFATGRATSDWREAICDRFGNWLNARLEDRGGLPMGDAEQQEWRTVLEDKLRLMREELDLDD